MFWRILKKSSEIEAFEIIIRKKFLKNIFVYDIEYTFAIYDSINFDFAFHFIQF